MRSAQTWQKMTNRLTLLVYDFRMESATWLPASSLTLACRDSEVLLVKLGWVIWSGSKGTCTGALGSLGPRIMPRTVC